MSFPCQGLPGQFQAQASVLLTTSNRFRSARRKKVLFLPRIQSFINLISEQLLFGLPDMGNISSRQRHGLRSNNIFGLNWSLDHQKLLRDVLPAYFQDKYPTTLDISRVCKLWKFLNKSSEMADLECDFTSNTVMEQFEDVFYGRIVDLCPVRYFSYIH